MPSIWNVCFKPNKAIGSAEARCPLRSNNKLTLSALARQFFIPVSIAVRRYAITFARPALDESDARQHQRRASDLR